MQLMLFNWSILLNWDAKALFISVSASIFWFSTRFLTLSSVFVHSLRLSCCFASKNCVSILPAAFQLYSHSSRQFQFSFYRNKRTVCHRISVHCANANISISILHFIRTRTFSFFIIPLIHLSSLFGGSLLIHTVLSHVFHTLSKHFGFHIKLLTTNPICLKWMT